MMTVTAYCPCSKCCGPWSGGKTASGADITANRSRFVAADTSVLPFGTKVRIPGYYNGAAVPVLDRGGKIKAMRLDVFFTSHEQARKWGVRRLPVTVLDG
jgi:3D (Asp-Asp-Asp) domain-containing protein